MLSFWACFSLAYVVTTLGFTGLYHLAGLRGFQATVRQHGIVPARLAGLTALLVVALELLLAVAAGLGLASREPDPLAGYLAAGGAAVMGLAFTLYLLRLVGSPAAASSCGCSPFAGETTRLSLAPAVGLALAGLLGTLGSVAGGAASLRHIYADFGGLGLLAAGWGATLAALVLLSPEALRVDAREDATWMA